MRGSCAQLKFQIKSPSHELWCRFERKALKLQRKNHKRFFRRLFLLQYVGSEEILKEGSLLLYLIQRTSLWEVHKLPNYYIYI